MAAEDYRLAHKCDERCLTICRYRRALLNDRCWLGLGMVSISEATAMAAEEYRLAHRCDVRCRVRCRAICRHCAKLLWPSHILERNKTAGVFPYDYEDDSPEADLRRQGYVIQAG